MYFQLVRAEMVKVGHVPEGMVATEIPTQRYIHHRHHGPVAGIADSFATIYDWAKTHGHNEAELKLDIGYTADGNEESHELYVAIHPVKEWKVIV